MQTAQQDEPDRSRGVPGPTLGPEGAFAGAWRAGRWRCPPAERGGAACSESAALARGHGVGALHCVRREGIIIALSGRILGLFSSHLEACHLLVPIIGPAWSSLGIPWSALGGPENLPREFRHPWVDLAGTFPGYFSSGDRQELSCSARAN